MTEKQELRYNSTVPLVPLTSKLGKGKRIKIVESYTIPLKKDNWVAETSHLTLLHLINMTEEILDKINDINIGESDALGITSIDLFKGEDVIEVNCDLIKILED